MADTYADDQHNDELKTSELDDEALYNRLRDWFMTDKAHSEEWRRQSEDDFNFVAGDQWEDKTKKEMADQKRPAITFNLTLSVIKAVAGLEINGRHELVFYPRGTEEGDVIANETLNSCSKWMGQNCDAEDEQSSGFEDTLVCGMGWTEQRMDYELEPEGMYIEEKCDPLEMFWDASARAKNVADARRIWRMKKMGVEDARALAERLGNKKAREFEDLNCAWLTGSGNKGRLKSQRDDNPSRTSKDSFADGDPTAECHVLQCQWFERESYNIVANPFTGTVDNMTDDELKQLLQKAAESRALNGQDLPIESRPAVRRVFKQAFLGGKVLKSGDAPRKDGFTFQCITGQLHKMKGIWFGLVRVIRDPQMMANKWLATTTQILATTAKGGIIAERTAFGPNVREAQKSYANPQMITLVEDGAITKGKIMAKPGAGIVGPYMQLMEFAIEGIWRASGMNQEIMGTTGINQPGVLEQQRKQAAMTILSTLFDSLRRYRKQNGRGRLFFIQNFLSDGRIIRIAGETGMKAIRLVKDKTVGEYDVMVDDSPTSPNTKEQTFAMLMQLMPMLKDGMTPDAGMIFLEYSPLPREAVDKLKKALLQPPSPEEQEQKRLAFDAAQAKVLKDQSSAGKSRTAGILDLARAAQIKADTATQELQNSVMQGFASRFQDGGGDPGFVTNDTGHNLMEPPMPPVTSGIRDANMVTIDQMVDELPPQPSPLNGAGPV